MSPGIKLLIYSGLAVSLFLIRDLNIHAVISGVVVLLLFFIPFKKVSSGSLPITLFLLFTFVSNLFYQSGRVVQSIGPVTLTEEGLVLAAIRTLRVFDLIFAAKVMTATTPLEDMVGSLKKVLTPLERVGLPVHDFFSTMALTLKCFPVIKQRLQEVYKGSVDGNNAVTMRERIQVVVSFLIPLFVESVTEPKKFFK